ncbi:MAG: polysaccharide deacetylase, partial [Halofilum sp. (in: g-proteobacteria)]
RLRHAQVGSSSVGEIRAAMELAQERGRKAFVILSHSAEMLTGDRDRADRLVVRRFERLCRLLADNRSRWPTGGFEGMTAADVVSDAADETLYVDGWNTTCRYAEQALRRLA